MAYIGNTASTRFVANRAASVYSGDGSTVAFTLEEAVGSDEDILVSVDGVIQEPSVGYAVSSGTTLTFSAAPSSNSGNNIFVYYLSLAKGSVVHPSNVGLTATTGVFSSTAQATVLKGTTSLQSPLIEFTDGDDAIAIADAGVITIKNTSSVIQGEGSATTIIAQGLCKHWSVIQGVDTFGTYDSFNQSGATDHGTGDHTVTYTTNFSDADGSPRTVYTHNTANAGSGILVSNNRQGTASSAKGDQAPQTSALRFTTGEGADSNSNGALLDISYAYVSGLGDLA